MIFDEVARERCKALVNKQALPTKYFPFYVALKYSWCNDFHLIGQDCGFSAIVLMDDYKKRGAYADMTTSYPFELMNPEKKK